MPWNPAARYVRCSRRRLAAGAALRVAGTVDAVAVACEIIGARRPRTAARDAREVARTARAARDRLATPAREIAGRALGAGRIVGAARHARAIALTAAGDRIAHLVGPAIGVDGALVRLGVARTAAGGRTGRRARARRRSARFSRRAADAARTAERRAHRRGLGGRETTAVREVAAAAVAAIGCAPIGQPAVLEGQPVTGAA